MAGQKCQDAPVSLVGKTSQPQPLVAPPLPMSIWVVAWASLAGQALVVAAQGMRDDDEIGLVVSVVLSGLIVGWVSAGVIRARTVRLVVAWIVLSLAFLIELGGIVGLDGPGEAALHVLGLTTSVLALVGLAAFHRTEWFAWQSTRPPAAAGAHIGPLVTVAVLVGALGGITVPAEDGVNVRISVVER